MKIYPFQVRQLKNTNPYEHGTNALYEEAAKEYDKADAENEKNKNESPSPGAQQNDKPIITPAPAPAKPENLDLNNLQNRQPGNVLDVIDDNAPAPKPVITGSPKAINSLDDLDREVDLNDPGADTEEKKEQLKNKARLEKFSEIEPILESDPALSAYLEYKKTKQGTFQEFLAQIVGDDISNYDEEQLFDYAARNVEGLTDEEEIGEYITEKMRQSPKFRDRDKQAIIDAHNTVRAEQLSKYKIDLRTKQEKHKAHLAQAHKDLQDLCKKTENLVFNGMVITPEVNEAISEKIKKDFAYYQSTDGYRIKESWELHFWRLYANDVIKLNASQTLNQGRDEVLNKVVRPSDNSTPSNLSLAPGERDDDQDKRDMDSYLDSKNPNKSF